MALILPSPGNFVALAGKEQVMLTWQAPVVSGEPPATNYRIYRSLSSGAETYLTTVNTTTFTDTSVTSGQTYFYKTSAVNIVGEGLLSNEVNATPFTNPSAPRNLQALALNVQVLLTWQIPASNGGSAITGYKICID